jgi:hypothetical protein
MPRWLGHADPRAAQAASTPRQPPSTTRHAVTQPWRRPYRHRAARSTPSSCTARGPGGTPRPCCTGEHWALGMEARPSNTPLLAFHAACAGLRAEKGLTLSIVSFAGSGSTSSCWCCRHPACLPQLHMCRPAGEVEGAEGLTARGSLRGQVAHQQHLAAATQAFLQHLFVTAGRYAVPERVTLGQFLRLDASTSCARCAYF